MLLFSKPILCSVDIYLLSDGKKDAINVEDIPIEQLEIAAEPIIKADDIASYDWKNHTISLSKTISLPNRAGVRGQPFIVVLNGEKKYLGAFWNLYSSLIYKHPVIELPFSDLNVDSFQINSAYWDPGSDPRADGAIKKALEQDGKLR